MPLWNELEGTRVADRFPLQRLLRSEGRNAWFETVDGEGNPATLSLFESLNDEDVLLARLRAAAALRQANLIAIREAGSAEAEESPLVFALMEPAEESLADVLRERPLTVGETTEIAESMLPALEAIHAGGMTHGRVEASSVLAAGETIKLRTDCLQANASESGQRADVRGLGALLYHALTQRRVDSGVDTTGLPAPFGVIVRNALGGQWTLGDVRRALKGPSVETARTAAASRSVVTEAELPAVAAGARGTGASAPAVTSAVGSSAVREERRGAVAPGAAGASEVEARRGAEVPKEPGLHHLSAAAEAETRTHRGMGSGSAAYPTGAVESEPVRRRRPSIAIAAVAIMALLLLIFWWSFEHHTATPAREAGAAATGGEQEAATGSTAAEAGGSVVRPSGAASQSMGAAAAMPVQPAARPRRPVALARPLSATSTGPWHVIAFTYHHQDQAQHKADQIAARHPELAPQVFSPTGHEPYLVALGAGMGRRDAYLLRERARTLGVAPDVYMQNY